MASFFFFLGSFSGPKIGTQKVPKKAPNDEDIYLSNVTTSVRLDANKSGCGLERERERAKGDAALVVFSASTPRWLWWKRTTSRGTLFFFFPRGFRDNDFVTRDYKGRGNIPIHYCVRKSRRFKTASSSSSSSSSKRFFFWPRKKTRGGKEAQRGNNDDSVLLASWKKAIIALHPKEKDKEREDAFEKRFNKKARAKKVKKETRNFCGKEFGRQRRRCSERVESFFLKDTWLEGKTTTPQREEKRKAR